MFENLTQAQRPGMTPRERGRFRLFAVMLLAVAVALVTLYQCRDMLPGTRDLPVVPDLTEQERLERHIDKEKVLRLLGDEAASHGRFVEPVLEEVRGTLSRGIGDVPRPIGAAELTALPFTETLGGVYEVTGKVTALVDTEYRSEFERLWALVIQGTDGGQVVAARLARATEPQRGAPTDAWRLAPAEIQVGDRVIVRGVYVQRRTGTIGTIGLADPTPVLLATHFRRLEDPPAVPIDDPTEASWDRIDDLAAGSERLDDYAIYQLIQWIRSKGHEWFRKQIDLGVLDPKGWSRDDLKIEEWGRDAFMTWSEELERANATRKGQPISRPFTEWARGRVFRTSGLVGKVLKEDWDAIRPNPWNVNSFDYVYLWSEFYGNQVVPTISPFPFETFGLGGWDPSRTLVERQPVYLYGIFVKTYTFDTQHASASGTGHQKLSMPLFLVLDVRPKPVREKQGMGATVAWVLGGLILGLFFLFLFLTRSERKETEAHRSRRLARAMKRAGGEIHPPNPAGDAGPPPIGGPPAAPGAPPP